MKTKVVMTALKDADPQSQVAQETRAAVVRGVGVGESGVADSVDTTRTLDHGTEPDTAYDTTGPFGAVDRPSGAVVELSGKRAARPA